MKKVGASEFKEQCLAILDHLEPEGLIITKHGKPVAKLIPIDRSGAQLIGALRGKVKIKGDLLTTGIKWEADA
jgi:prevent-host-death family protein